MAVSQEVEGWGVLIAVAFVVCIETAATSTVVVVELIDTDVEFSESSTVVTFSCISTDISLDTSRLPSKVYTTFYETSNI